MSSGINRGADVKPKTVNQDVQNVEDIRKLKEDVTNLNMGLESLGVKVDAAHVEFSARFTKLEENMVANNLVMNANSLAIAELVKSTESIQNSLIMLKDIIINNNNKNPTNIMEVLEGRDMVSNSINQIIESPMEVNKLKREDLEVNIGDDNEMPLKLKDDYDDDPESSDDENEDSNDSMNNKFIISKNNKLGTHSMGMKVGNKSREIDATVKPPAVIMVEEQLNIKAGVLYELNGMWFQIHGDSLKKPEKLKHGVRVFPPKGGTHIDALNGFSTVTQINNKPEHFMKLMQDLEHILVSKHIHQPAWENKMITRALLFPDIEIFNKLAHVISNKIVIFMRDGRKNIQEVCGIQSPTKQWLESQTLDNIIFIMWQMFIPDNKKDWEICFKGLMDKENRLNDYAQQNLTLDIANLSEWCLGMNTIINLVQRNTDRIWDININDNAVPLPNLIENSTKTIGNNSLTNIINNQFGKILGNYLSHQMAIKYEKGMFDEDLNTKGSGKPFVVWYLKKIKEELLGDGSAQGMRFSTEFQNLAKAVNLDLIDRRRIYESSGRKDRPISNAVKVIMENDIEESVWDTLNLSYDEIQDILIKSEGTKEDMDVEYVNQINVNQKYERFKLLKDMKENNIKEEEQRRNLDEQKRDHIREIVAINNNNKNQWQNRGNNNNNNNNRKLFDTGINKKPYVKNCMNFLNDKLCGHQCKDMKHLNAEEEEILVKERLRFYEEAMSKIVKSNQIKSITWDNEITDNTECNDIVMKIISDNLDYHSDLKTMIDTTLPDITEKQRSIINNVVKNSMKVTICMRNSNNAFVDVCEGQLDTCNNSKQPLIDSELALKLSRNNGIPINKLDVPVKMLLADSITIIEVNEFIVLEVMMKSKSTDEKIKMKIKAYLFSTGDTGILFNLVTIAMAAPEFLFNRLNECRANIDKYIKDFNDKDRDKVKIVHNSNIQFARGALDLCVGRVNMINDEVSTSEVMVFIPKVETIPENISRIANSYDGNDHSEDEYQDDTYYECLMEDNVKEVKFNKWCPNHRA
jgi:hypothetical protein